MTRSVVLLGGLMLCVAHDAAARAPRGAQRVAEQLRHIDPLLVKAYRAMSKSYAPFSRVHAGCALTTANGPRAKVLTGFNSESQGDVQLCAEQAAMAALPRGAAAKQPVQKIAIIVDKATVPLPCGRCLQTLCEVGSPQTIIVAANLKGKSAGFTLRELMPSEFSAATRGELAPYRALIAEATRAYRASRRSGVNRYRPAFGAVVQTDAGSVLTGMVIKDTASTFTPATENPLEELVKSNAMRRSGNERMKTVVIVGRPLNGALPLPTGDERQHLVDANPEATVVLYNPVSRAGAVLRAGDLLPYAYKR
jgi:cytidine deaminase